jgi:hypothetical protein
VLNLSSFFPEYFFLVPIHTKTSQNRKYSFVPPPSLGQVNKQNHPIIIVTISNNHAPFTTLKMIAPGIISNIKPINKSK